MASVASIFLENAQSGFVTSDYCSSIRVSGSSPRAAACSVITFHSVYFELYSDQACVSW